MSTNPYKSPSLDAASSGESWGSRTLGRMVRALLNVIVVVAFTAAVGGAIWLFYNGYPWTVGIGTLVVFMVLAWFAGKTWRERIAASLSVPFFALGGYVGLRSYFAMFHFSWFEALFNDKGGFPVGLIVFVGGCAVATGFPAALALDRVIRRWLPDAVPPDRAEPSHPPEPAAGPGSDGESSPPAR